ncbi:MAG: glycosyltransferase family 2 protein [Chloroflexia bacterium]
MPVEDKAGRRSTCPRVSVVIAAYNAAPFLEEAIDSILHQTFPDLELIVVDDGSTDETPQILDRYADSRIIRLRNETNQGVARARNGGNAVARGEYLAVQDADDLSTPDRVEKQVAFLDAHPEIGLVGSQGILFGEGASTRLQVPLHNTEIQALLLGENCLLHSSLMMRREVFEAAGGYDETYAAAEDYDLVLRIAERACVANLPAPLYLKRMAPGSITYSPQGLQQQRCALRAVEEALRRRSKRGQFVLPHPRYALTCLAAACAEAAFGEVSWIAPCTQRALEVDRSLEKRREAADTLANYALGYAFNAGATDGNPLEIARRVFASWPGNRKPRLLMRRTYSFILAGLAFRAYRSGRWKEAAMAASASLARYPVRPGNRGLLAVASRSAFSLVRGWIHTLGTKGETPNS